MSTTLKIPFKRIVRRANSGQITNTQWLGGMSLASDLLVIAPWLESDVLSAVFPVNVPTTSDFSSDTYDCFKQSGNAQSNTGTECVFVGMSVYRLAVPASASATFVSSVSFRCASDKFCVGGLKVAAILSDSETPPSDWNILRSGGNGSSVDATGKFATYGTMDGATEIAGILAETSLTVNGSTSHVGDFTLDLSSVTTYYKYIYLAISLFDYESYRREYWVEGSGAIDGASIEVTFDGAVTLDEPVIVFPNEFSTANTSAASRFDASYETVNLTHSAGVFYDGGFPSQSGDLSMMRRIIAMRNVDSVAPRHKTPSGTDLGFGVCDSFSLLSGKIGVVYESVDSFDVYRLFGVTVMRGIETDGGVADGISFDAGVTAFPSGQIVRVSFYGVTGMLPSLFMNGALIPQYSSFPHSITKNFVYGNATSFFLNVGVGGGGINSGAIDSELNPFSTISLTPLGYFDTSTGGIAAATKYPFSREWKLPSHAVIVVTANVIKYTSDWVAASQASTAETWEPNDITLHLV